VSGIVGLEAQEFCEAFLVEVPGREPRHFVDVLLAVLAGREPHQVVQEGANPGVARLRIGRDPDGARLRCHASTFISYCGEPQRLDAPTAPRRLDLPWHCGNIRRKSDVVAGNIARAFGKTVPGEFTRSALRFRPRDESCHRSRPSLRGTLLTSASAVALSVSASGASAQTAPPATAPGTWSVWIEGAPFWTGGSSFNVPSPAGVAFPGTAFKPSNGIEGAAGFDYRWAGPWHVVADVRYGRSKTVNASAGAFFSSPVFFGPSTPIIQTVTTASSGSEKESHLVADFMVGRDLGVGSNAPELMFGIRVADLQATAHVNEIGKQTFYFELRLSAEHHHRAIGLRHLVEPLFRRRSATGADRSVPIAGFWSLDYLGGAAVLIGDRSSSFTVTTNGVFGPGLVTVAAGNTNTLAAVVNADGWAALSYAFTPSVKVSGGIRADYYVAPLVSYNFGTLQNIDRLFWGPFVRLTGRF
jgi:hypothetical protein